VFGNIKLKIPIDLRIVLHVRVVSFMRRSRLYQAGERLFYNPHRS